MNEEISRNLFSVFKKKYKIYYSTTNNDDDSIRDIEKSLILSIREKYRKIDNLSYPHILPINANFGKGEKQIAITNIQAEGTNVIGLE